MFVITADQRDSRSGEDLVPSVLAQLERRLPGRIARGPERTVGDEIQLATDSPDAALDVVLHLTRSTQWHVGIGCGPVDEPLPDTIRAARGPAFVHARDAVERAKRSPGRLALSGPEATASGDAESLLRLLVDLRDHRTDPGWEVADLLATGITQKEAAERLAISETAVSLRVKAAGIRIEEAAVPALARVLARADGPVTD